jgi:hypothetical protein
MQQEVVQCPKYKNLGHHFCMALRYLDHHPKQVLSEN